MTKEATVTVVVGQLDPLTRFGLAHVLREDPGVEVLASDLQYTELEHAVAQRLPRVAVLDESEEPLALARLRSAHPATGVIVLAHNPSHSYGLRLLTSGATCLARSVSATEILAAIHLTSSGERVFVASDGNRLERRYPSNASTLTPRETEVLAHLSRGRSNPEIARTLQISVETVNTHVASIRRKLNVQSKRELIGMPVPGDPGWLTGLDI
ncbi:MAG: response regulator transcription factor [Solirubrobacteraceae bacterium]